MRKHRQGIISGSIGGLRRLIRFASCGILRECALRPGKTQKQRETSEGVRDWPKLLGHESMPAALNSHLFKNLLKTHQEAFPCEK
jgi:hypothetical protein